MVIKSQNTQQKKQNPLVAIVLVLVIVACVAFMIKSFL